MYTPPLPVDQHKTDTEHLRLLTIFHYIAAGLCVAALAFLGLHYAFFSTIFSNPETWKDSKGGPPPAVMLGFMIWFYRIGAAAVVLYGVLNLMSALSIAARRRRTFSLFVAALNCLHMPMGTALGAFTFVVLLRDSVREIYRD